MLGRLGSSQPKSVAKALRAAGHGRAVIVTTVLMVLASLVEVVGVASIAPFVAFVATGTINNQMLQALVGFFSWTSPLVVLGAFSFLAVLVASLLQLVTNFAIVRVTYRMGETLSGRMFEVLVNRPLGNFVSENSSEALTGVLRDVNFAVSGVLVPALATAARLMSMFAILVLLVIIDPMAAGLAGVIALGSYIVAFRLLAPRIAAQGRRSHASRTRMFQLAMETFEAIREVKAFAAERFFVDRFASLARRAAGADAASQMMRQLPRYVIELFSFGAMILIVILLVATSRDGNNVWPLLAIYALAAWRLLPAAQALFDYVTAIRHYWPCLDRIEQVLASEPDESPADVAARHAAGSPVPRIAPPPRPAGTPAIALEGVGFAYDSGTRTVVEACNLTVAHGEKVAIVGRSGAGKTTLLGLCLGLLEPSVGTVRLYGLPPRAALAGGRVAYVAQHPALLDDTVRRNVAFGAPDELIDEARVRSALEAVGLVDLAADLDQRIGDRGQGLSGGERQRLALARALYREPELLVLDEFTSALDAATERELLDTIARILGNKSALIVTHCSEVLAVCDRVVEL
jgi:ABC-type multidrug transport system fused ATPase/permease subunit